MIRQRMVPPVFRADSQENQRKFIEALSESLQGLMQVQTFADADGEGGLEIMALGPLVLVRYKGSEQEVPLPFKPDGDAPLSVWPALTTGRIKVDWNTGEGILEFSDNDRKIACGWCISRGSGFGKKGGK